MGAREQKADGEQVHKSEQVQRVQSVPMSVIVRAPNNVKAAAGEPDGPAPADGELLKAPTPLARERDRARDEAPDAKEQMCADTQVQPAAATAAADANHSANQAASQTANHAASQNQNSATVAGKAPRRRGRRKQPIIQERPVGLDRVFVWSFDGGLIRCDVLSAAAATANAAGQEQAGEQSVAVSLHVSGVAQLVPKAEANEACAQSAPLTESNCNLQDSNGVIPANAMLKRVGELAKRLEEITESFCDKQFLLKDLKEVSCCLGLRARQRPATSRRRGFCFCFCFRC